MSMIDGYTLKDGDIHVEIDHATQMCKVYEMGKGLIVTSKARTEGVGGPDWRQHNADTPPGDYEFTDQIVVTASTDYENLAIYGPIFFGLRDCQGQERNYGRDGIGFHGGRQGQYAYDPAKPHNLEKTHGCIRGYNDFLWNHLYYIIRHCKANGGRAFVTVNYPK